VCELLHEEGITCSPVEDEFTKLRHRLSLLEDGLNQLGAGASGELVHANLAVVGLTTPLMGVFRAIQKDHQDMCISQRPDEIGQELLRCLIDPV